MNENKNFENVQCIIWKLNVENGTTLTSKWSMRCQPLNFVFWELWRGGGGRKLNKGIFLINEQTDFVDESITHKDQRE